MLITKPSIIYSLKPVKLVEQESSKWGNKHPELAAMIHSMLRNFTGPLVTDHSSVSPGDSSTPKRNKGNLN